MKELKVTTFEFSTRGDCCSTLRVGYPLSALDKLGIVKYTKTYMSLINMYLHDKDKLAINDIATNSDIILFQRPDGYALNLFYFIEELKKVNPDLTFITEVDDSFFTLDPYNDNALREIYTYMPVITSTQYLASFIKKQAPLSKVYLYETKVPMRKDIIPYNPPKVPTILHSGTNTHEDDINGIESALVTTFRNHDFQMIFWGNSSPSKLQGYVPHRVKEWQYESDYERYTEKFFKNKFTFSLNPLTLTRKNWAKSGIKYIECGQKGMPSLFSMMPEYYNIVAVKELLVEPHQWEEKIDWLLRLDKKQLKEIGHVMKKDVKDKWLMRSEHIEEYYNILLDCKKLTVG